MRQRDYFLQQTSAGEQIISNTIRAGMEYGVTAAHALKPDNVSKSFKNAVAQFRTLTWGQLIVELFKLLFRIGKGAAGMVYFVFLTLFRFAFYLMTPEEEEMSSDLNAPSVARPPLYPQQQYPLFRSRTTHDMDAFGIHIHSRVRKWDPSSTTEWPEQGKEGNGKIPNGNAPSAADKPEEDDFHLKPPQRPATPPRSQAFMRLNRSLLSHILHKLVH
uniref:Uncharacterized protein n=1 Tax=Ditylenchus dipsaci TaxID=166011 RepID=A0A915DJH2_9BILA